jgi:hypothetical protein
MDEKRIGTGGGIGKSKNFPSTKNVKLPQPQPKVQPPQKKK